MDKAEEIKLTAIKDPSGGYTIWWNNHPEIIAEGKTLHEAKVNLAETYHDIILSTLYEI